MTAKNNPDCVFEDSDGTCLLVASFPPPVPGCLVSLWDPEYPEQEPAVMLTEDAVKTLIERLRAALDTMQDVHPDSANGQLDPEDR